MKQCEEHINREGESKIKWNRSTDWGIEVGDCRKLGNSFVLWLGGWALNGGIVLIGGFGRRFGRSGEVLKEAIVAVVETQWFLSAFVRH